MTMVSVIIKALNEEAHIARAIESALAALDEARAAGLDGELILADSGSRDGTLAIAAGYPIRVARLKRPQDRSCGAGPQLGYQHCEGDYVCLMDGDMTLDRRFIVDAAAFLARHPDAAGAAGSVIDKNVVNLEFKRRALRPTKDLTAGPVDRLNGGGLYRREAIESVGYFSDRNLHGYEEFDLAVRLRQRGWALHRLAMPFADHYGYVIGGYPLLLRRYASGYLFGVGEVLRGAMGEAHWGETWRGVKELRIYLAVIAGWLAAPFILWLAPTWGAGFGMLAIGGLAAVALMSWRSHSLALGLYSVVAWHAYALGLALGFLRARRSPRDWIDSELSEPAARAAPARETAALSAAG